MLQQLWETVKAVKEQAPLVHNITNYVVMNNSANALLALGASPVMAHALEEVEDMAGIAGSLVINIGTLEPQWVEAMKKAMITAKRKGTPIVIDPVGLGATPYRNEAFASLIDTVKPTVIRGNGSEIMAALSTASATKGVDSTISAQAATDAATELAGITNGTVCISGEEDWIITSTTKAKVLNNIPLYTKVTGMGCTATALTGACLAVTSDPFMATLAAMATMGVVGEVAMQKAQGPGTLQLYFLDALYNLNEDTFMDKAKIEVIHE
ncbi:hydroxyethylthiazole kinase [Limibacter armeniacum]|uniref:hydroxyethylthiazole kinase n=1 Tax=Limibacter armeniacum TaxID=466084 RepID=UPI002FE596F7